MPEPVVMEVDPFSGSFLSNPNAFYEDFREAGPVLFFPKYNLYGVARYDDVKRVVSEWESFCSSRGIGLTDLAREENFRPPSLLVESDPPLHDKTRRIISKVISLAHVKSLKSQWSEVAATIIDKAVRKLSFDVVSDIAQPVPLQIIPDMVGLQNEGRENLQRYPAFVFNSFGPRNEFLEESERNLGEALEWIAQVCRYENLAPGSWGQKVSDLAADAGFEEAERELLVRTFLTAGIDTTINSITNLVLAFCDNPEQWQLLRADRSLMKRAIDESFRWGSPALTIVRTTTRDVDVSGVAIPEGAKVISYLGAANRDPRHWDAPETFDITRPSGDQLGFGFGIHQCIGQMIARQELEIVTEALLDRVSSIKRDGPPARILNNFLVLYEEARVKVELA